MKNKLFGFTAAIGPLFIGSIVYEPRQLPLIPLLPHAPQNDYATNAPVVIEVYEGMGNFEKSFPRGTRFMFQCARDSHSGDYPTISMDIIDPQGSIDPVIAGGQSDIYTLDGPEDQVYEITHLPSYETTMVTIKVEN